MIIKINDKVIEPKITLPAEWQKLLQVLLADYIESDHGITQVIIDSEDLTPVLIENPQYILEESIKEIIIHTHNSQDITIQGLQKIKAILASLVQGCHDTANLYRKDNISEASSQTVQIIEAVKEIINFIHSVGYNLSVDYTKLKVTDNETVETRMNIFLNSLNELISAQQKKDYTELSDFMEYQLAEDLESWATIINAIEKFITDKNHLN